MAAADAEGAVLGAAVVLEAGLGVDTGVGAVLGDAAAEQAAIAIASAGTRRVMDRFMTDDFPSGSGWVSDLTDSTCVVFSTKSILSSRDLRQCQLTWRCCTDAEVSLPASGRAVVDPESRRTGARGCPSQAFHSTLVSSRDAKG